LVSLNATQTTLARKGYTSSNGLSAGFGSLLDWTYVNGSYVFSRSRIATKSEIFWPSTLRLKDMLAMFSNIHWHKDKHEKLLQNWRSNQNVDIIINQIDSVLQIVGNKIDIVARKRQNKTTIIGSVRCNWTLCLSSLGYPSPTSSFTFHHLCLSFYLKQSFSNIYMVECLFPYFYFTKYKISKKVFFEMSNCIS